MNSLKKRGGDNSCVVINLSDDLPEWHSLLNLKTIISSEGGTSDLIILFWDLKFITSQYFIYNVIIKSFFSQAWI